MSDRVTQAQRHMGMPAHMAEFIRRHGGQDFRWWQQCAIRYYATTEAGELSVTDLGQGYMSLLFIAKEGSGAANAGASSVYPGDFSEQAARCFQMARKLEPLPPNLVAYLTADLEGAE